MGNEYRVYVEGQFVGHAPMRVLCLNAPPTAGKDTVADFFEAQLRHLGIDYKRRALADIPKRQVAYRHGVKVEDMFSRAWKDRPWRNEKTPRDLVIEFSEQEKKVRGQNLWARLCDEELEVPRRPDLLLVTDLGFDAEWDYFRERYPSKIVRISRPGTDYSNDSRQEIAAESHLVHTIHNDGSLDDLRIASQFLCHELASGW